MKRRIFAAIFALVVAITSCAMFVSCDEAPAGGGTKPGVQTFD